MESVRQKLNSEFPGRKNQIDELLEYFHEDNESSQPIFPHIHLFGLSGSGRSVILQRLLSLKEIKHCTIYCDQSKAENTLYPQLLDGLDNDEYNEICEDIDCMETVCNYYMKAVHMRESLKCVVLKHSENLSNKEVHQLVKFQETLINNGWNFSLVFISSNDTNLKIINVSLVTTFFPRYTKEQLHDILMMTHSKDDKLIAKFLDYFLSVIMGVFNDLADIRKLVSRYYELFKMQIGDDKISENNLVLAFNKMNLKITSLEFLYEFPEVEKFDEKHISNLSHTEKNVLLAAFLASYISKSDDKKFFCTFSSKIKKQNRHPGKQISNDVKMGPKSFTFHRLLAIYRVIVRDEEKNDLNLYLISQIATLIKLKLLEPVGVTRWGNIDEPNYKCVADFDCILTIAKHLGIKLENYIPSIIS